MGPTRRGLRNEPPIGRTTLSLCVITVSPPTEIISRPYRNIFAAKIAALSFALLTQLTIFSASVLCSKKGAAKCLAQSDLRYYLARPKYLQVRPGWFSPS